MQIIAAATGDVTLHGAHSRVDTLVLLAVAFLLSYAILDAACRVRASHGRGRLLWLVAGSLVIGLGIFSFHFISLMTVGLPLPFTSDPMTFGVSAVTAVIAAAGALHHINRGVASLPPFFISAGLKGFALVATHYTSMAALHVPASVVYRPGLVAASVLIAVAVSAASLALAERLRSESPRRAAVERLIGAGLLAGGLVLMHYISSGAGTFSPDPEWVEHATAVSHIHHLPEAWLLPWIAGGGAVAVAGLAVAASLSRGRQARHRRSPALDRLTGLANGALLRERLTQALEEGRPSSLVLVRLKRFEQLAHRLGRRDAETLVVRVGQRLRAGARPDDLVACLGMGEFCVLVGDDRPDVAQEVADRLADRLANPVRIGDLQVVVPALIGATPAWTGERAAAVLTRAQLAVQRTGARPVLGLMPSPEPAVAG